MGEIQLNQLTVNEAIGLIFTPSDELQFLKSKALFTSPPVRGEELMELGRRLQKNGRIDHAFVIYRQACRENQSIASRARVESGRLAEKLYNFFKEQYFATSFFLKNRVPESLLVPWAMVFTVSPPTPLHTPPVPSMKPPTPPLVGARFPCDRMEKWKEMTKEVHSVYLHREDMQDWQRPPDPAACPPPQPIVTAEEQIKSSKVDEMEAERVQPKVLPPLKNTETVTLDQIGVPAVLLPNGLPNLMRQVFAIDLLANVMGLAIMGATFDPLAFTNKTRAEYVVTHILIPKQIGSNQGVCCMEPQKISRYMDENNLLGLGCVQIHSGLNPALSSRDLHVQANFQQIIPQAVTMIISAEDEPKVYQLTERGMQEIDRCQLTSIYHHHGDTTLLYKEVSEGVTFENINVTLVDFQCTSNELYYTEVRVHESFLVKDDSNKFTLYDE